ncbi:MAG: isochorismatase [Nitrospira sp. WS238]|nr:isochorismatase [Nitrospira sp. WS238]
MSHQPKPTATGLLIIDMINEFTFDGAEKLFPRIEQAAQNIARLKQRVKAAGLPVLYVNDNFGKWRSDFKTLVNRCLEGDCRGKHIAELLQPEEDDYFVLKPKHSGFFATPLEVLLRYLKIQRVILTGVAGDNCVLFTAADAYMRNFDVAVPADCTISIDPDANRSALEHMRKTLKADMSLAKTIIDESAA